MLGYLLAFGTALFESFKDLTTKVNLRKVDEYVAIFAMQLVQSVVLLPLVLIEGFHLMNLRFLVALISGSIIQLVVVLLYFKAIKASNLSVSVPLLTLTPLFMLITSPMIIGQFPTTWGLIGIILVVLGTYILNIDPGRRNLLEPFRSIFRKKGSRYMFIVAFLWSLTAVIDKIGVEETSPIFWAWSKDLLILFYFIPILMVKSPQPLQQLRGRWKTNLSVGLLRSASVVSQMFAIQFLLVPYVIAIKRSSALLIIIWAFIFLNERSFFRLKLTGMIIIIGGLICMLF